MLLSFEHVSYVDTYAHSSLPHKDQSCQVWSSSSGGHGKFRWQKNLTKNRRLLGIPFIGKDAPSPFAEFAHPDAVIGLTILAYRYDGLRRDDVVNVLNRLKSKFERENGPKTHRKSYQRWESWKQMARCEHLPRIDRLEPGTTVDVDEVFKCENMRLLPEMIHSYLHEYVFPSVLRIDNLN